MGLLTPTTSPSDSADSNSGTGINFWLLALRCLAAVPMIYYQSWNQALRAWGFVWEKQPWPIAEKFVELDIPQPEVLSASLIFLLLVCPFGVLIGFLTRINAFVTMLAVIFVMITGIEREISQWLNAQVLLLYLGMCLILTLSGGGIFSFDTLLTKRWRRKKQKQIF